MKTAELKRIENEAIARVRHGENKSRVIDSIIRNHPRISQGFLRMNLCPILGTGIWANAQYRRV